MLSLKILKEEIVEIIENFKKSLKNCVKMKFHKIKVVEFLKQS